MNTWEGHRVVSRKPPVVPTRVIPVRQFRNLIANLAEDDILSLGQQGTLRVELANGYYKGFIDFEARTLSTLKNPEEV